MCDKVFAVEWSYLKREDWELFPVDYIRKLEKLYLHRNENDGYQQLDKNRSVTFCSLSDEQFIEYDTDDESKPFVVGLQYHTLDDKDYPIKRYAPVEIFHKMNIYVLSKRKKIIEQVLSTYGAKIVDVNSKLRLSLVICNDRDVEYFIDEIKEVQKLKKVPYIVTEQWVTESIKISDLAKPKEYLTKLDFDPDNSSEEKQSKKESESSKKYQKKIEKEDQVIKKMKIVKKK